jgi:predicted molibdopterin-dependent oxidoreductase YjgC
LQSGYGIEIIGFDNIFTIGSNASVSHPIIENRIRKAYHHGAKIITAHSHLNRTFQFSNERIIYHPGSENIFLLQILNDLKIAQNIKFPKDISDALKLIDTRHAATATGIRQAQIRNIIESLAPAKKILIIAGDTLFKSSLSNDNFNLLSNIYFALNKFADCRMMFLVDDGNCLEPLTPVCTRNIYLDFWKSGLGGGNGQRLGV